MRIGANSYIQILKKFILIFIVVFCVLYCLLDYPRNVTFSCSKNTNSCTYSSYNLFRYKSVKTIVFDKISKSGVEQQHSLKLQFSRRMFYPMVYYYYDWIIYYDNNGTLEKLNVFRTSDYEKAEMLSDYDVEYRYLLDITRIFNDFMEDNSKFNIFIPEDNSSKAKEMDYLLKITNYAFVLSLIFIVAAIVLF